MLGWYDNLSAMRAIFIDLDRTLLDDEKNISKRNLEALNKAKEAGFLVAPCTGRAPNRANKYFSIIDSRYVIYANGGGIFDRQENKLIYESPMVESDVVKICKVVNDNYSECANALLVSGQTRHLINNNRFDYKGMMNSSVDKIIETSIEEFLENNTVVNVEIACSNLEKIKDLKAKLGEQAMKSFSIEFKEQSRILSDPNSKPDKVLFLKIADKKTSKGSAINWLCEKLGIKKEERIGIGDDINDLPMFDSCGYNVAMGNGLEVVKKKAHYVTLDNNNDGVAEFLTKIKELTK